MATLTQGIDGKAYLAGWLQALTAMMCADIKAIPDDKWTATFGGCTRPANMLLSDTITNLRWTTDTMKGETSKAYDGMAALAGELADKNVAIAKFNEATAAFSEALGAASDEILQSTVMAPWQMPTPVFMLAQISVSHVWYHDGQLNYIQCLLGDEKVHWMAP